MKPLRVAFICNEYPPGKHGGIGTFTRNLGRELVASGHHVRVIGLYDADQIDQAYQEDDGVRVWRLPASRQRFGWIGDRYRLYRQLVRWSRNDEVDVVELADWEGWAAGWPRLRVPIVVRLNGSATYFAAEMSQQARWITRSLEGASLRRADFWCSVSEYTAQRTRDVLKLRSGPRAILYNSVELRPFRAISDRSACDVVFTGTLTRKKGVLSLVRCWRDVLDACPDARLHIYGKDGISDDGASMRDHLTGLLDPSTRETVSFHGHQDRDRIHAALDQARVAVFPSYAEAFSLAPLEAMACGCPTIYSQRGSGRELIDPGKDGLLVDPDHVESLGAAVVSVLNDDELADRLGTGGRQRVAERFTTNRIVNENVGFYRQCLREFANERGAMPAPRRSRNLAREH